MQLQRPLPIPGIVPCCVCLGTGEGLEVPVQVGWWHWQGLQWQPGCGAFSSRVPSWPQEILHYGAIRNRNPGHVLMNSCWSSPGRVNANAVKCKKALVSWDKAFCSRGKANEIISVTQDLVRTFCIYGVYSVLSRYLPVVQMPPSSCKCIPCCLCVNYKPSAAGPWVSAGAGFPSSSPHSQQLREICWPVSVQSWK